MKRLAVVLTIVLAAAGLLYIPSWGEGEIGRMTVRERAGEVVIRRGSETIPVEGSAALKPGDEVSLVDAVGLASLRLDGDRRAELRDDAVVEIDGETSMSVTAGSVLADADNGDAFEVGFDDVVARTTGHSSRFRVDQGFGFARAAVYAGGVELAKPGSESLEVGRLFEASVAGGVLPLTASPFVFDEADAWDQANLGPVIELDQDLATTAGAVAGQLAESRPSLPYFRGLAGRPVNFMRGELDRRVPELLIGFSVADQADEPLPRAFRRTFALRDQGGPWGVVATLMEVRPDRLLASLGDVVLATGVVAGEGPGGGPDFSLAAGPGGGPTGDGGPGDTPPGGGNEPNGPGGDPPDGPGETPPPPTECDDPECIEDLTDSLCPEPLCDEEGLDGSSGGDGDDGDDLFDDLLGGAGGLLLPVPLRSWHLRRSSSRRTTRASD